MSDIVSVENYPSKAKYVTIKLQRQEALDLAAALKQAHKFDRYAFNIYGRPSDLVEQLDKVLAVNNKPHPADEFAFLRPFITSNT